MQKNLEIVEINVDKKGAICPDNKIIFDKDILISQSFENKVFKRLLRTKYRNKQKILNVGNSFAVPTNIILFPKYGV